MRPFGRLLGQVSPHDLTFLHFVAAASPRHRGHRHPIRGWDLRARLVAAESARCSTSRRRGSPCPGVVVRKVDLSTSTNLHYGRTVAVVGRPLCRGCRRPRTCRTTARRCPPRVRRPSTPDAALHRKAQVLVLGINKAVSVVSTMQPHRGIYRVPHLPRCARRHHGGPGRLTASTAPTSSPTSSSTTRSAASRVRVRPRGGPGLHGRRGAILGRMAGSSTTPAPRPRSGRPWTWPPAGARIHGVHSRTHRPRRRLPGADGLTVRGPRLGGLGDLGARRGAGGMGALAATTVYRAGAHRRGRAPAAA